MTWLLATQLLLFTAFTTIFVKFAENNNSLSAARLFAPLSLICLIGMFTSILAWSNIRAAQKMVKRIQNWWLQHYCPPRNSEQEWLESVTFGKQEDRFPPINGILTKNLYVLLDETKLPGAIAVAWLILLVLASIGFISAKYNLERNCVALVALYLLLIFLLSLKYIFEPLLRAENPDARNALIHFRGNLNHQHLGSSNTPNTTPNSAPGSPANAEPTTPPPVTNAEPTTPPPVTNAVSSAAKGDSI